VIALMVALHPGLLPRKEKCKTPSIFAGKTHCSALGPYPNVGKILGWRSSVAPLYSEDGTWKNFGSFTCQVDFVNAGVFCTTSNLINTVFWILIGVYFG
jgi:hypothetical protein